MVATGSKSYATIGKALIVGVSLMAVTVRINVVLVVWLPSLTVSVIVAVPEEFGCGMIVSDRLAPLP